MTGKSKILSTIDAQVTGSSTHWDPENWAFQSTVLPCGLHGAPAAFQRLMDQVPGDVTDFAAAYLDDITYSTTWEELLEQLRAVLDHLHAAGLTVNPSKCVFAATETEYLGHVIGNVVIQLHVNKIQAIRSCPLPHTRKQLRWFLGTAGFYPASYHGSQPQQLFSQTWLDHLQPCLVRFSLVVVLVGVEMFLPFEWVGCVSWTLVSLDFEFSFEFVEKDRFFIYSQKCQFSSLPPSLIPDREHSHSFVIIIFR